MQTRSRIEHFNDAICIHIYNNGIHSSRPTVSPISLLFIYFLFLFSIPLASPGVIRVHLRPSVRTVVTTCMRVGEGQVCTFREGEARGENETYLHVEG